MMSPAPPGSNNKTKTKKRRERADYADADVVHSIASSYSRTNLEPNDASEPPPPSFSSPPCLFLHPKLLQCIFPLLAVLYAVYKRQVVTIAGSTSAATTEHETLNDPLAHSPLHNTSSDSLTNDHHHDHDHHHHHRHSLTCDFVMAPSAIPGAGWGVFSLKTLQYGDALFAQNPILHIVDLKTHQNAPAMAHLLHNYSWSAAALGAVAEGNAVYSLVPGLGMLANTGITTAIAIASSSSLSSNAMTVNVWPGVPQHNVTGLERTHPNTAAVAGSSTTYHMTFHAAAQGLVRPGSELLIDYGQQWERAGKMHDFVVPDATIPLLRNASSHSTNTNTNNYNDDDEDDDDDSLVSASSSPPHRSVKWLVQHGLCVDHLRAGSTLTKGRGAFAVRDLTAGTVIAPAPVLPLPRSSLEMDQGGHHWNTNKHQQLLLNYCFGHVNSSLLLFPYAPMVNLINHNATHPNAYVRWSTKLQRSTEWFRRSALEVLNQPARAELVLEVVALRDIAVDEEITMNYGSDWTQAWERHVATFAQVRSSSSTNHVYPNVANRQYANQPIRTLLEQREHPYPSNLQTSCFYDYDANRHHHMGERSGSVTTVPFQFTPRTGLLFNLRPCLVHERHHNHHGHLYTVEILDHASFVVDKLFDKGERHLVTDVPREYIRFTDRPYSTDPHLPGTFRHSMSLPSGVFPSSWIDMVR